MAESIRRETAAGLASTYAKDPAAYGHSTETFKMAVLAALVKDDWKIRYNPALAKLPNRPATPHEPDPFFRDARDVFLHGCATSRRSGTCASLPVLFTVLGRRLGYPLHLAMAEGHLYCIWRKKDGTRLNFDATNRGGLAQHPESYYRGWPVPLTPWHIDQGCYLRPLTNREAAGLFLHSRAAVLHANGAPLRDLLPLLAHAHNLFPQNPNIQKTMAWPGVLPPVTAQAAHPRLEADLREKTLQLKDLRKGNSNFLQDLELVSQGLPPMYGTLVPKTAHEQFLDNIHNPTPPTPHTPGHPRAIQDPARKTLEHYKLSPHALQDH